MRLQLPLATTTATAMLAMAPKAQVDLSCPLQWILGGGPDLHPLGQCSAGYGKNPFDQHKHVTRLRIGVALV